MKKHESLWSSQCEDIDRMIIRLGDQMVGQPLSDEDIDRAVGLSFSSPLQLMQLMVDQVVGRLVSWSVQLMRTVETLIACLGS